MRNQKLSFILLAAIVGTALLALAPTAEAQQSGSITITLTKPEIVQPLQGSVEATATVVLRADYGGATGLVGIPVQYTITCPAWATCTPTPASDVFDPPNANAAGAGAGGSYTSTKTVKITISASDQAPAFTPQPMTITATTSGATGGNPITGLGSSVVEAGFFSILDVQVQNAIVVERPQTIINIPVSVNNLGNAQTKVTFSIAEGSTVGEVANALQPQLPPPTTLGSKQAGATVTKADIVLTVQTPYKNGYMNDGGTLNYKITSAYAINPALRGDESQLSVLVTTRGFYVPGMSPILLLGLVGGLALAMRRFR